MNFNHLLGVIGSIALFTGSASCLAIVLISAVALQKHYWNLNSVVNIIIKLQAAAFSLSVLSLGILLQRNAYNYSVVFNAVENSLSFFTKLSGLWAGQAGSLLFWAWLMSLAILLAMRISDEVEYKNYSLWIAILLCGTLLFFLIPVLFIANPFTQIWLSPSGNVMEALIQPAGYIHFVPLDGAGMNPALRHPAMLIHPPTLYLGLIGFFIPYSFAAASLILDDNRKTWVSKTLPFTIAAFVFLTCGMFLGSWWAYTILGWGGYWGWDAVEISGLLPWLLSFGLLHSMIAYLKTDTERKWIYGFAFSIFLLTLFGILLTRSGIIESVHAYTAGGIGPALTLLIIAHLSIGVFLLAKRWNTLCRQSPSQINPTKTTIINLFNIILVLLVLIYLYGQTLPATSKIFSQAQIFFQPDQYERCSGPLLLFLLLLTAWYPMITIKDKWPAKFQVLLYIMLLISLSVTLYLFLLEGISILPVIGFSVVVFALLAWLLCFIIECHKAIKLSSLAATKLGSTIIHIGFLVMALGILSAENLHSQQDFSLAVGESTAIENYTIRLQSKQEYSLENEQRVYTLQTIIERKRGDKTILSPEYRYFPKLDTLYISPDILSTPFRDLQISITDWEQPVDGRTNMRAHIFPLMNWLWFGGALMAFGGTTHLFTKYSNSWK